jgi:hypothetical protein
MGNICQKQVYFFKLTNTFITIQLFDQKNNRNKSSVIYRNGCSHSYQNALIL